MVPDPYSEYESGSTHVNILQCCGSGSVFRIFVDPYPYSESGSTHVNMERKNIGKRFNILDINSQFKD